MKWNKIVFGLLMCLAATAAMAQKVAVIDASNSPNGNYYYQVIVTDDGVTVVPLTSVVRPTNPGGPVPPTDPTNPTTTQAKVTTLTKQAIAGGGSPTIAKGLAALYGFVAKSYADGSLGTGTAAADKAKAALDLAHNAIMSEGREEAKWKAWKTGVDKILKSKMSAATLYEIAAGLKAGTIQSMVKVGDASPAVARGLFDNIDIDKLIKIIMIILKLFGIGF